MKPKGKELLFESFEDRRFAVFVGFFCLIYFGVMYLPENSLVAKILPVWPLPIFSGIAGVTFVAQIFVWRAFKHFYKGWYRFPFAYILFVCELGLLLFTILFCSWPFFWIYSFFTASRGTI